MKKLNILITVLVATAIIFAVSDANAQSNNDVEVIGAMEFGVDCSSGNISGAHIKPKGAIVEEDYPYLMNLNCLSDGKYMTSRGWNWKFQNEDPYNPSHFKIKAKGSGIDLVATYDSEGILIGSFLTIKDTRIPPPIRRYINSEKYDGWSMVENEKFVKNFDRFQTEYKVVLSDGINEKTLTFRDLGNSIAFYNN